MPLNLLKGSYSNWKRKTKLFHSVLPSNVSDARCQRPNIFQYKFLLVSCDKRQEVVIYILGYLEENYTNLRANENFSFSHVQCFSLPYMFDRIPRTIKLNWINKTGATASYRRDSFFRAALADHLLLLHSHSGLFLKKNCLL